MQYILTSQFQEDTMLELEGQTSPEQLTRSRALGSAILDIGKVTWKTRLYRHMLETQRIMVLETHIKAHTF